MGVKDTCGAARAYCLLLAIAPLLTLAQQPASYIGTTLTDAITRLETQGLAVIYSNDLVRPSMLVVAEPVATTPTDLLIEILAPHGLTALPGPGDRWLVARQAEPSPPSAVDTPTDALGTSVPERPPLELIEVSASRYALGREMAGSSRYLSRTQLEDLPTLGQDAVRATHSLPGVTSNGLSAQFNVRGGETNEALLLLDGMRLYNPYHLKGFQSLFSSINPRILEGMAISTGGYPARFGDRMSGVIEMDSLVPVSDHHYELGISTLETSLLGTGRFLEQKGDWLVSLRRGNLDLLTDATRSDIGHPQYVDFFGKFSIALNDGWNLSTNVFRLDNKISLNDTDIARATADYADTYFWVRLDQEPGGPFAGHYLISRTQLSGYRSGTINDPQRSTGQLFDQRSIDFTSLKADWSYQFSDRHLLQWGIEVKDGHAQYAFESNATFLNLITIGSSRRSGTAAEVDVDLAGEQQMLYGSYRTRLSSKMTTEFGIRWDRETYLNDHQLSPRLNLIAELSPRTTLRAAWGKFFQTQSLDELQVRDGIAELLPRQEAEHTIASIEFELSPAISLRIDVYRKEFKALRPRFENLFSPVSLLPELLPDRVRMDAPGGKSTGFEFLLNGAHGYWTWWLNLDRSSAKDNLGERVIPRSWHQSWSFKAGGSWTKAQWTISLAASAHSGWPTTPLSLVDDELVAGEVNSFGLGTFRSIDIQATRRITVSHGELSFFGRLINALNSKNECCVDYRLEMDQTLTAPSLETKTDNWLPLVPELGFLWQF